MPIKARKLQAYIKPPANPPTLRSIRYQFIRDRFFLKNTVKLQENRSTQNIHIPLI